MDITSVFQWFVHFFLLIISCYLGNLFAHRKTLKDYEKLNKQSEEIQREMDRTLKDFLLQINLLKKFN